MGLINKEFIKLERLINKKALAALQTLKKEKSN